MAEDIVAVIISDQKPLKQLLKMMKEIDDSSIDIEDIFEHFRPVLVEQARSGSDVFFVKEKQIPFED